ncbi:MAG TPA: hypothetical protein PKA88_10745 [Polyangiaceae bacterium]|nr:hypothetical protein [Polyangiaceae bacterium]HMR77200.1 hypothetical protein [Polyangiaceae bacterium]
MKRESQETWAKRVERWQDSGLTSEAFCSEAGFNPRTLKYWKWRLGKAARSDAASARSAPRAKRTRVPRFVEVTPPPAPAADGQIEITVRSVTLRVPAATSGELGRVVDALKGLA